MSWPRGFHLRNVSLTFEKLIILRTRREKPDGYLSSCRKILGAIIHGLPCGPHTGAGGHQGRKSATVLGVTRSHITLHTHQSTPGFSPLGWLQGVGRESFSLPGGQQFSDPLCVIVSPTA